MNRTRSTTKNAKIMRQRYRARKRARLCVWCAKRARPRRVHCVACAKKNKMRQRTP